MSMAALKSLSSLDPQASQAGTTKVCQSDRLGTRLGRLAPPRYASLTIWVRDWGRLHGAEL